MLGDYKGGLYMIPSFCLMLAINIYQINAENLYTILRFSSNNQLKFQEPRLFSLC